MAKTPKIDIDYVANLARVDLTDEEKVKFSAQLSDVLAYFDKLKAVDVSGIEPTAHAFPPFNVWGGDVSVPGFNAGEALLNAPKTRDYQVVVPKVVEDA